MKLTILQTGDVPEPLAGRFMPYPQMFERMFAQAGAGFSMETLPVHRGAPPPDPAGLEAVLITGSAAGVYDRLAWLDPLRGFIRAAYAARTPMVGICFGHQIMADALGGAVRKADKGWGIGRHSYTVAARPPFMATAPDQWRVACSHQDQVVVAPPEADTILQSAFTPFAGLHYRNGAALSLQPHPEFDDDYARALAELRRGSASDQVVETALSSMDTASDAREVAVSMVRFFKER